MSPEEDGRAVSFPSLNTNAAGADLAAIHERVCLHKHRIELLRDGCGDVCVLISKTELDFLEHALDVLMQLPDAKAMHEDLVHLATSTMASFRHRRGELSEHVAAVAR